MRADLQNALLRSQGNSRLAPGTINYIEKMIVKGENIAYATKATITTGHIENNQIMAYSVNQNISGLLVVTDYMVWHFSKGQRHEACSLDNVSIEIKKHLFTNFIHLRSIASDMFYMNIFGLKDAELHTVAQTIKVFIDLRQEQLEELKKPRKKSKIATQ